MYRRACALLILCGICVLFCLPPAQATDGTERQLPIDLSDYERMLQTAVVASPGIPVALTSLARQYLDPQNPDLTPVQLEGELYLPAWFLAHALGWYIAPDGTGITVMTGAVQAYFGETGSWREENGIRQTMDDLARKVDGAWYLHAAGFAAFCGKTACTYGAVTVIDEATWATAWGQPQNAELLERLQAEMASYAPAGTTGRTLYVSRTSSAASDDNPGTRDLPFATLSKAGQIAQAGDTVLVGSGVYRETLTVANNGTPGAPIRFLAEAGASVTLSAAQPVTGFVPHSGKIWKAPVGALASSIAAGKHQVYIGGEAVAEGRHPNVDNAACGGIPELDLSPLWPTFGDIIALERDEGETDFCAVSEQSLQQPAGYWTGATFVCLSYEGWAQASARVKASEPGRITLEETSSLWWFPVTAHPGYDAKQYDYGYLTGHLGTLDLPYEWTVQDGWLYMVKPDDVATLDDMDIQIKVRQNVIDLSGKQSILLEGIHTFGGSVVMADSEMCVLSNMEMRYLSHFTRFDDARDGFLDAYWQKRTKNAPKRGEVGNYIGGRYNAVVGCRMDHSAGAGIYLTGQGHLLENNTLTNCGYMGIYPSGIFITFAVGEAQDYARGGHHIYHNSVSRTGRCAISIQANNGAEWSPEHDAGLPYLFAEPTDPDKFLPYLAMEIAYNDFFCTGIGAGRDGGSVGSFHTTLGDDRAWSRIHHNLVWDHYATGGGGNLNFGIYYDNGTQNLLSYDNVMFSTRSETAYKRAYLNNTNTDGLEGWYDNIVADWGQVIPERVPGGKAALSDFQYPYGIPFVSGVMGPDSLAELPGREKDAWRYPAEVGGGAQLAANAAVLTDVGQWVKYASVPFHGANKLAVCYTGEADASQSILEVSLDGIPPEGSPVRTVQQCKHTPLAGTQDMLVLDLPVTAGIRDVYIRQTTLASVTLLGVRAYFEERMTREGENDWRDSLELIHFWESGNDGEQGVYSPVTRHGIDMVGNTWHGNWVRYRDVVFDRDVTRIELEAASEPPYAGGRVQLFLDDRAGVPVAEGTITGKGFGVRQAIPLTLNGPIAAGVYDVYLRFEGENKTSNVYRLNWYAPRRPLRLLSSEVTTDAETGAAAGTFAVENVAASRSASFTAYLVRQDADGRLVQLAMQQYALPAGVRITDTLYLSGEDASQGDRIQLFIWESDGNRPVG